MKKNNLKTKWYMNYCHTLCYYFDMRAHYVPALCAIAQTKTFARHQPEFSQGREDNLYTTLRWIFRCKYGRGVYAPACIKEYLLRKSYL